MISILIPAKNEKAYLPRTLESIRKQDYKDLEIIVADANSTDQTVQIAEEYDCKIVSGGLPAVGANSAARAAKGELLLFLAADVVMPEGFLKRNIEEIQRKGLDCATTRYIPISDKKIDHLVVGAYNIYAKLTQKVYPMAGGFCIFSTKEIYDAVGGFNENIRMGEDFNYVKKCSKVGRFGFLDSVPLNLDIRRLEKEGRFNLFKKYVHGYFYRIFKGEMYNPPFDYSLQGNVNVRDAR